MSTYISSSGRFDKCPFFEEEKQVGERKVCLERERGGAGEENADWMKTLGMFPLYGLLF